MLKVNSPVSCQFGIFPSFLLALGQRLGDMTILLNGFSFSGLLFAKHSVKQQEILFLVFVCVSKHLLTIPTQSSSQVGMSSASLRGKSLASAVLGLLRIGVYHCFLRSA